jgi:gliding motility-associated-like protein
MKKLSIYILFLLITINSQAQTVNQGILKVSSNTVTSFLFPFSNQEKGRVTNDGLTYFYSDFNNDGIYSIGKNVKTGKAVFTRLENQDGTQTLSGNAFSEFYNIDFNNPEPFMAFNLKNSVDVYGTVDFQNGIIKVDSALNEQTGLSKGILSFHRGAKWINASHNSHVEGEVEKIGNDAFTFPIGDKGLYRPARITAPKTTKDAFVSKYILDDTTFFKTNKNKSGVINLLNEREYWIVEKGSNVSGDIMLTLSWDERTTSPNLLSNPEEELHIVRWDKEQQLWVDEGGVVDSSVKEVTTAATVKGYGIFTLGTVKKDWILEGDVVIYNLVTPDNDGKNDYFIIENINRFPNNKVEIYNRWGGRVYETTSYNSRDNVFRGYSDGRVTVNKGSKLPTGTYFYIVTYEYKNENGFRMIKKSGYLHLENN